MNRNMRHLLTISSGFPTEDKVSIENRQEFHCCIGRKRIQYLFWAPLGSKEGVRRGHMTKLIKIVPDIWPYLCHGGSRDRNGADFIPLLPSEQPGQWLPSQECCKRTNGLPQLEEFSFVRGPNGFTRCLLLALQVSSQCGDWCFALGGKQFLTSSRLFLG